MMFDKAGDMVIIYSNPVHDYTDYVLDELGLGDEEDVIK
jgi:outer membrane protein